jgi:adenine-specific DNA-methyltransferase
MPILHWLNDEEARKTSSRVPYRLLEADNTLSHGDPNTENMLIQGDNLEALKALLPYYAGQVKCIYIDPPYNTKSAFEHYDDNLEHSTWLTTMYPRLEMLRDLLSPDGSIWVSIDDTEGHYLKVLMDEIFGRNNFVTHVVWQRTHTRENRTDISTVHDTILVFAKDRNIWKDIRNLLPTSDSQIDRYSNPDNDPRGSWASLPAHAKAEKGRRQAQFFTITTPAGRKVDPPSGRCWLYTEPRFFEMVEDNRIWFGADGNNVPRVKKFLSEVQTGLVPSSLWLHTEVGTTGSAKSEMTALFPGEIPFSTPKPEKLIERLIHIATNPGELVLDSFLGSGTTAAVAHKMGRRYIGIEMGEHAVTHCAPRLQKVVDGEQGGISEEVNWQGGGGFHFYHLGEAIFNEEGQINLAVKFRPLAAHVWFTETHTPLELKGKKPSPLLGIHNGTAYYLLYNGILGDKTKDGGNVLTGKVLASLPPHHSLKVIYGELTTFGSQRLTRENIIFKQVPYDIKAR